MNTSDAKVVAKALKILDRDLRKPGAVLSSPSEVKAYLTLQLAQQEREVFGVLWLDVGNAVIAQENIFFGTLTTTSVHPRELVKAALKHNAAGMICYHNHPSGKSEPGESDLLVTRTITQALALVDVRILDHIIIGGIDSYSFAEHRYFN